MSDDFQRDALAPLMCPRRDCESTRHALNHHPWGHSGMNARPILFSGPMVRALLKGRKTQTRRIVRPQPESHLTIPRHLGGGEWQWCEYREQLADVVPTWRCPYGRPGYLLWVRETWYCDDYRVQRGSYLKPEDFDVDDARCNGVLVYKADGDRPYEAEQPVWRPSIFMPRWASRITLRLTDVRVERLQDIRGMDALREGVSIPAHIPHDGADLDYACREYRHLWESINGPGSWDADPWVWALTFDVIPRNVDAVLKEAPDDDGPCPDRRCTGF